MKHFFCLLSLSLFIFSCSSDDSNYDNDDKPKSGHYTLIVNGDGLTDKSFVFNRDNILGGDLGLKFTSSDDPNNNLYFVLPPPIEIGNYEIMPYNINNTSVSSVSIMGNGIYLSVDGSITLSEIATADTCVTNYIGTININYRRQDNAPGAINVQGTFDIPPYSYCEPNQD
ncbi:hypothetical protein [Psychroserpens ponticola]|uniref:Lipoprotein n=1 Tax=Psychroserpens ponticola TaxID=2932268 RepID=A0ABY7S1T4_9FLAO|nr:hypothetical protein [Psychroserpens ponticola]WCO03139.1 hypothetical protein MUN68_006500 [Psychroserpens ponticola]